MNDIEKQISELKKKQAELEQLTKIADLKLLYDQLKKLEGTVKIHVNKTNKRIRSVQLIHHISFSLCSSGDIPDNEPYIAVHNRKVSILENPLSDHRSYEINSTETKPNRYDGKLYQTMDYNFKYLNWPAAAKVISIDQFNTIWDLVKVTSHSILDGLLDIKDLPWLLQFGDEFRTEHMIVKGKSKLDIPHILLTTEESNLLDSSHTNLFRNKNIYFITPNSLQALMDLDNYHGKWDAYADYVASLAASVWQGSRRKEYLLLVNKIKNVLNE